MKTKKQTTVSSHLIKMHTAENTAVFKKYAPVYDLIEFVVGNIRKEVTKNIPAHSKILDVACGTGTHAVALANQGHFVTGIDLSRDMLKRAKAKQSKDGSLTFIEGDATKMDFATDVFDVSMISFGIHDMPEKIAIQVLREMKRVTKKGGSILVLDYGTTSNTTLLSAAKKVCNTWESDHYKEFIEQGINHYLKAANLTITNKHNYLSGLITLTKLEV